MQQAKAEAQRLIADANRTIENTIRTIREAQAEKEATRQARRELETFRGEVEQADAPMQNSAEVEREMERLTRRMARREENRRRRAGEASAAPAKKPEPEVLPIEVGSKVRIEGQEMPGVVQSIKGRKAQVAFGQILTTVEVSRLTAVSNAEYKKAVRPVAPRTVVSVDIASRKLNFHDSVDVRGMRAAEALAVVQDLVDDALMVGVSGVTILHGKGTGALKEEIRRYLHTVPEVESVRDEHADRGGAGITVEQYEIPVVGYSSHVRRGAARRRDRGARRHGRLAQLCLWCGCDVCGHAWRKPRLARICGPDVRPRCEGLHGGAP